MIENQKRKCLNCENELTGKQIKFCSKECRMKKWKEDHPEHYKKYYQKNKEKIKCDSKKWKEDHPEHYKEYNNKYSKKWRENHSIYNKNYSKKWGEKRSEKFHTWKANFRCRLCDRLIENGWYIDLHHIKEKKFLINTWIYFSALKGEEKAIEEIIKTVPLCKFCHADITRLILMKKFNDKKLLILKNLTIKREEIK